MASNMALLGNSVFREGVNALRNCLPSDWSVDRTAAPKGVDAYIRITAPDKKSGLLAVEAKRSLEPRGVFELKAKQLNLPETVTPFVIAPFLSPAVRERLSDAAIAFLDLTGNIRLKLRKPALFIETQGAEVNPNRKERPSRSLRGSKAGRVVRTLIDSKKLLGVREIAEIADVDPGYVSRVLSLLDSAALIERQGRGQIIKVDWQKLLKRWAEESPLSARGVQATFLEPRGIEALQSKLKGVKFTYAITGSLAAAKFAPISPARLATIYVEDIVRTQTELDLRIVETGANVLLIESFDAGVFSGAINKDGLSYVALSQAVADLLTSPGRGPAEAEELLSWMVAHEEVWHG